MWLTASGALAAPTHPLDPLDADELLALRDIVAKSGEFSADTNFAWIALDEPPKAVVEAFRPGRSFRAAAALDGHRLPEAQELPRRGRPQAQRIATLAISGTRQPA